MNRVGKKAKKIGQFSIFTRPQLDLMSPIIFFDTSNQTWISPPCMCSEIYKFISIATPSNRPSLMEVWDNDEYFREIGIYDDELVKIQRSKIHKVVARPIVFQIMVVV